MHSVYIHLKLIHPHIAYTVTKLIINMICITTFHEIMDIPIISIAGLYLNI